MKWQKECPYCGKVYKSKRFYKLHLKKHEEPKIIKTVFKEVKTEKSVRTTRKIVSPRVKYREIVYLGTADLSSVKGLVTGKKYKFFKDKYKMPQSTKVDERDYPGIIAIKGKGCARRDPSALYMSKLDWELELEKAKVSNR